MQTKNILIVEDEALVAEDLKAHIIEMGYQVSAIINNGEDVLTLLEGSRPDLVMMDIVLQGEVDGIDVAAVIKQKYHIPVIYLTAYTDKEKLERAQATEPYGYLVKPFDERELQTTIGMALYKAEVDRKLRESQRWGHAVLGSIADAVITLNRHAKVNYINAAAEQLTGLKLEDVIEKELEKALPLTEHHYHLLQIFISDLQTRDAVPTNKSFHTKLLSANGKMIPIDITIAVIHYDDGDAHGLVIAFRDVTQQQQVRDILEKNNSELEEQVTKRTLDLQRSNKELIAATHRAEVASDTKSRFLSVMSHELRSPLIPIMGYAELLKSQDNLSEEQREYANTVYLEGKQMLSMVDDILEIAQSDTGELTLQLAPFDASELIRNAELNHSEAAKKHGLEFDIILPQSSPPFLKGDPGRIIEILNRLLDNAIRFTPEGKVILKLDYKEIENEHATLRFSITDTGIGVADKSKVFEPLTQLDDSLTRRVNGTGLGLTIAKRLVEIMDGQIEVEDNPQGGSIFWFEITLPIRYN